MNLPLACLVLSVASSSAASAGLSLLLRASLLTSGQPSGNAALAALDTDGDGRVSPGEVTAFATAQGLDAKSAAQEFAGLDTNGDGILDSSEVAAALGTTSTASFKAPQPAATAASVAPFATLASSPAIQASQSFLAARSAASLAGASRATSSGQSVAAEAAASSVVEQLALEERDEAQAEVLERHAAELRTNATHFARLTSHHAAEAGLAAARKKAEQLMKELTTLEEKAKNDEVQAAGLRANSRAEVLQADELIAVASSALKQ